MLAFGRLVRLSLDWLRRSAMRRSLVVSMLAEFLAHGWYRLLQRWVGAGTHRFLTWCDALQRSTFNAQRP